MENMDENICSVGRKWKKDDLYIPPVKSVSIHNFNHARVTTVIQRKNESYSDKTR